MTAHDGSLVAQVEDWMVSTITTANGQLAAANRLVTVDHFFGALSEVAKGQVDELFARGASFALVHCRGDGEAVEIGDADEQVRLLYYVIVGVSQATGDASARLGGATPGVHYYLNWIRHLLHGQHPGSSVVDSWYGVDHCWFVRVEGVWQQQGRWISIMQFEVAEVPKQ